MPLAPAAGEVAIPDDHLVQLELSREAVADLAWLDALPADAIDSLSAYYIAPLDDADVHRLSRLAGLRSLDLGGTGITSKAAASLAKLVKLQHLSLNSTQIDDDAMTVIAALPELETVGLYGTGITDVGLNVLAGSPSLKAVYVGRTRITDAGVAALCKLADLRALNLLAGNPEFRGDDPDPSITDHAVDSLCTCANLEYLDISGAELTDAGLQRLAAKLTNLRGLVLDFTKVTPKGMRHLAGFAKLEQLRVQGIPLDDEIAGYLANLSNLRGLTGDTEFSDAGVKKLGTLQNLESLDLDGHLVTDASMPVLKGMRELRELSIQHTRITDEGFAMLAGAPSIERIQLTGNRVTTRCIETLAEMPRLRRVGLMSIVPRVDGEPAWKGLEGLSSLEDELWICVCPSLSPDDFAKLSKLSALKQLRIEGGGHAGSGRAVTDEDLSHIARLDRLEFLELTSTVVTDESLALLAELPALRGLSISCLATDAGLAKLAQAPVLEHLTIGSPNLTEAAIGRLRAENPRIASIQREPFRLGGSEVSRSPSDAFWRKRTVEERKQLNLLEGKAAPQLSATNWLNAEADSALQDYRGKVVLVEFWGTWCGPCIAQLPEIRRLHDEYADRGLVVIGVHSSKGAENAAKFVQSNKLPWPIALDDENQSKAAYCVDRWPSCYLVDRQGVLRMADIFDGDREAAIEALLSEDE
jgi:thiol-disulfide isomerase/thioredoxin/Leucine-rich repeat (LRR) protein